ncbi:MAG TPA: peptidase M14 [Chromatiales bacterium]|nr:peptidase M14 [Chromatiales bacterium]
MQYTPAAVTLTELDHLPDPVLHCTARELYRHLPGPTLVHLPGRREPPLFVSVLLHGNEPVGLQAIQQVLAQYHDQGLPRALSVFFGNVAAARHGLRRLDGQPDYNRIWPGGEEDGSPEAALVREVFERMRSRGVFASVDIHNNTGINPHYACVNRLESPFLQLATLFGRTVVYFLRPRGVQSMAFAELCPAVTLECGRPGERHGIEHAAEYVEACLHLSRVPNHPVAPHDIDLFHTVAQVKVREEVSFSFGEADADLVFEPDIDHFNFRELPAGTVFGRVREGLGTGLIAFDEAGRPVTERYFAVEAGLLTLVRPAMPSMLTLDERVVRQDCLCYLMERLDP